MRATAIEFRLRGLILTLLVLLGFWAPWIQALDLGKRVSMLEWLALEISRAGLLPFLDATPVVIGAGALLAALGMVLRVWGAAYMGPGAVNSRRMQAPALIADGPYRYLRNPLYLGSWFMLAAISFLMPPTGALAVLPLITLFLVRLVLGEEKFLTAEIGDPYRAYQRAVPRLVPRLRSSLPPGGRAPHWLAALAAELNPISVFIVLAAISWSYDHELMIKALLVGFGLSLVARALVTGKTPAGPVHA
jgi:protein-S-isoprenylcysteine O-methyltransferase Ste14